MGIFHKFVSAAVDDQTLTDTVWANVDWNDDHLSPAHVILSWHEVAGDGSQWASMPAAVTVMFGDARTRINHDMRFATSARLVVNTPVAGASGAELRAQYSTDGGTNWLNLGPTQSIASVGLFASAWAPIPAGAQIQNCLLRIAGANGNGSASPKFRSVFLQAR